MSKNTTVPLSSIPPTKDTEKQHLKSDYKFRTGNSQILPNHCSWQEENSLTSVKMIQSAAPNKILLLQNRIGAAKQTTMET